MGPDLPPALLVPNVCRGNTGVEARGMFSVERCGRTAYLQGTQKRKKKNLFCFLANNNISFLFSGRSVEIGGAERVLSWAGGALRRHRAQCKASSWGDVGQAGRGGRTAELFTCPRSCPERAGSPRGITLLCPCEGAKRLPVGAPCLRGVGSFLPCLARPTKLTAPPRLCYESLSVS